MCVSSSDMGMMDAGQGNEQTPCSDMTPASDMSYACALTVGCAGLTGVAGQDLFASMRLTILVTTRLLSVSEPNGLVIEPHLAPPIYFV